MRVCYVNIYICIYLCLWWRRNQEKKKYSFEKIYNNKNKRTAWCKSNSRYSERFKK